jgi:hypothetical protein
MPNIVYSRQTPEMEPFDAHAHVQALRQFLRTTHCRRCDHPLHAECEHHPDSPDRVRVLLCVRCGFRLYEPLPPPKSPPMELCRPHKLSVNPKKGRSKIGTPRKVTRAMVAEMVRLYDLDWTMTAIGQRLGVSRYTVRIYLARTKERKS